MTDLILVASLSCPIKGGLGHAGFNQPRTDSINANAAAIGLIRRGLHDADDACLAGRIIHASGVGAQACHGSRAQNGAMALGQEVFEAVFDREENTDSVHAQGALPVLNRQLGDGFAATRNPSIGVNAVDAAVATHTGFNERCNLGLLADVCLNRSCGAAIGVDVIDGLSHRISKIHTQHLGAIAGREQAGGTPDTATGTGDDDVFIVQHECP